VNFVVLGCGRSGTSLLAGLFHQAGFHVGTRLHEARDSNPVGFYESDEINKLNNRLLEGLPSASGLSGWVGIYERPVETLPDDVRPRLEREVARAPFCFKDPRFTWTLPAWAPLLGEFVVLCAFRDPVAVIHSLVTECTAHYPSYGMVPDLAERIWTAQYETVFEHLVPRFPVHFVHYEDVLSGRAVEGLGRRFGLALDPGQARRDLDRSRERAPTVHLQRRTLELHGRLLAERLA